jgi:hypothetical protein
MAVGIQTRGDPQSVRRQVTLEHVGAGDVKDIVTSRCHVEAAIT